MIKYNGVQQADMHKVLRSVNLNLKVNLMIETSKQSHYTL